MKKRSFFSASRNPIMKASAFERANQEVLDAGLGQAASEPMSVEGAVNKAFILGGIMLLTALVGFAYANPLFIWGGAIGGLVLVLVMSAKPSRAASLAPIYAGLEGLFVGSLSAMYASLFSGIVLQAVTLTMAAFFMMLFLYKSGIIRVTDKLRSGVIMATGAIAVVYIVNLVLSFFGLSVPYLHEGGMIGIGISLLIIGVACLNLLLDFDNFERGAAMGAPKYMEWFTAMGLIVTLVWLYVEILRLLAIFSGED